MGAPVHAKHSVRVNLLPCKFELSPDSVQLGSQGTWGHWPGRWENLGDDRNCDLTNINSCTRLMTKNGVCVFYDTFVASRARESQVYPTCCLAAESRRGRPSTAGFPLRTEVSIPCVGSRRVPTPFASPWGRYMTPMENNHERGQRVEKQNDFLSCLPHVFQVHSRRCHWFSNLDDANVGQ